jgi:Bacterial protein of unknown function (Gcw_chp)
VAARRCNDSAWSAASIAALVGLWLTPTTGGLAHAQSPSPAGAIGLGNRGWSAADTNQATSANELDFSARAGLASDYIYRGTTLSDHKPAAGAAFEAKFDRFYAGTTLATVKLPTQPVAELTFAAGVRPKIATIDFDFGVTYFAYPGERLPGRREQRHQLLGDGHPRRSKHRRTGPRRRRLRLFAECLEHRRLEPICSGRGWLRRAGPAAAAEPDHIIHGCCRLFLVR